MLEQGQEPVFYTLSDKDFLVALQQKILEEAAELRLDTPEKLLEELADIQEVLDMLLQCIGKSKKELQREQVKKNKKSGSFKKKMYVEKIAVPAESIWAKYYEKELERFTESGE